MKRLAAFGGSIITPAITLALLESQDWLLFNSTTAATVIALIAMIAPMSMITATTLVYLNSPTSRTALLALCGTICLAIAASGIIYALFLPDSDVTRVALLPIDVCSVAFLIIIALRHKKS